MEINYPELIHAFYVHVKFVNAICQCTVQTDDYNGYDIIQRYQIPEWNNMALDITNFLIGVSILQ